ncbi:hypothetical protein AAVH_34397, partial [Aphelenchoides avenae]
LGRFSTGFRAEVVSGTIVTVEAVISTETTDDRTSTEAEDGSQEVVTEVSLSEDVDAADTHQELRCQCYQWSQC